MDFQDVTCGVVGPIDFMAEQIRPLIVNEVQQAIQDGFTIFQLAIVGRASLTIGNCILEAINGRDGISLELMVPFQGRVDLTLEEAVSQFNDLAQRSNGTNFVTDYPTPNTRLLLNNGILDLSNRLIAVYDGKDDEIKSIIHIAEDIETPVVKISI